MERRQRTPFNISFRRGEEAIKSEEWGRVKRGQTLILANTTLGVLKVTVIELDVEVEVTHPTYRKENPWGLTAQTGSVKIRYNETETMENLQNLMKYSPGLFARLRKAYNDWQQYNDYAVAYREVFTTLISEEIAK